MKTREQNLDLVTKKQTLLKNEAMQLNKPVFPNHLISTR